MNGMHQGEVCYVDETTLPWEKTKEQLILGFEALEVKLALLAKSMVATSFAILTENDCGQNKQTNKLEHSTSPVCML